MPIARSSGASPTETTPGKRWRPGPSRTDPGITTSNDEGDAGHEDNNRAERKPDRPSAHLPWDWSWRAFAKTYARRRRIRPPVTSRPLIPSAWAGCAISRGTLPATAAAAAGEFGTLAEGAGTKAGVTVQAAMANMAITASARKARRLRPAMAGQRGWGGRGLGGNWACLPSRAKI